MTCKKTEFVDTKWKHYSYDHKGYINQNMFHTFDKAFSHVVSHMNNMVARFTDIKLREVEIPQADPASIKLKDSIKKYIERSILPRAVAMYNIESQQELMVDIPNTYMIHRVNGGPQVCMFSIKRKRMELNHEGYDYAKDVDIMLNAVPNHTSVSIFYSILVSEKAKAIELMKLFKFLFPLQIPKPIYAEKIDMGKYKQPQIIPYTLETLIPTEAIDRLKQAFSIDDIGTAGDKQVLDIIQKHSQEQIDYLVDGGNRQRAFAIKYPCIMHIKPMAIDLIQTEYESTATHGIKIELLLDYIEFPVFNLRATMQRINTGSVKYDIKNNMDKFKDTMYGMGEIPVVHFSEEIDGLTILTKAEVTYIESDIKKYRPSPDSEELASYAELDILDIMPETPLQREYLEFIYSCYRDDEIDKKIRVEAQRTNRVQGESQVLGNDDKDFFFSGGILRDRRPELSTSIYVALYVDKKHYNDWLEKRGYRHESNLTAYN